MDNSLFPVVEERPKNVPLWIAELALKGYSIYHPGHTLEDIAKRGGFGQNEIVYWLAEYAGKLERELEKMKEAG